ncbi:MAG: Asp-tRNA(Asn)/Glu-tRNA(Gln) amidotransferase subunit GatB [Spirochaetes bacterium]|nr:Asp-tRNA(Asn)/Glu-tRNA(Gln) amidotransferase subunit GatB [Spirochaetota bacterium]
MGIERAELIVGCEVHVQLLTKTKAFCACENRYGGIPNTRVCPTCLALPGALPRVNRELLDKSILAGLALNCTVASLTKFDRKNYMYPDLPKGYQISQFDMPICEGGWLDIDVSGTTKRIGIIRLHMEEDAGKNLHIDDRRSYVDFNRCGAPLAEIVSKPDIRSAEEASAYVQGIREVMRFIGVSECNMEEGSLRCDVNVNLHVTEGVGEFATPIAEIKNLNSFRSIRNAIAYEERRQLEEWKGKRVTLQMAGKQTRGWDDDRGVSVLQRTKEEASDYRYFPEPDLKPIVVTSAHVERIRAMLPELPRVMRARFEKDFGLTAYDAQVLTTSSSIAAYFDAAAAKSVDPKKAANWIQTEVLGVLNTQGITVDEFPVPPEDIAKLVDSVQSGINTISMAKDIFSRMINSNMSFDALMATRVQTRNADGSAIAAWVDEVLAANPKVVEDWKRGRKNAALWLMGQVMKKSGGTADAKLANAILERRLQALQ